jgi:hypothetical protein
MVIPENSEVGFVRLVDQLIAYEEGQITQDEEVAIFAHLVETGCAGICRGTISVLPRPLSRQG